MKRYSLTYFIGQSLKSLWRNGIMTFASISVLMSCLVVMGSFALLVVNINFNLEQIGVLNEILLYVDTSLPEYPENTEKNDSLTEAINTASGDTDTTSSITIPPSVESFPKVMSFAEGITSVNADTIMDVLDDAEWAVIQIDAFTQLSSVQSAAAILKQGLPPLQDVIYDIIDVNERAKAQAYYNYIVAEFERVNGRIEALSSIELKLRALDNVDDVSLVTKKTGFEEQKEKFSDFSNLFEAMSEIDNNLPDKFIVTYKDNSAVDTLQYHLENLDGRIYKIKCDVDVSASIENVKHGIVLIFSWFFVILFVVSIFVIMNTIKIAVYSRKAEISIMRYVGATNLFISLPFIFEGIFIGLMAGGIAYGIQYYMYHYVVSIVGDNYSWLSLIAFNDVWKQLLAAFLITGMATGVIGSAFSSRRYMKA